MKIDFRAFAQAAAESGLGASVVPVVEKEIVHYEILRSLSEGGFLSALNFQGGTCLRMCYGGQRFSEDLDFSAGENYGELDWDAMAERLSCDLLKSFDVNVRVRKPQEKQFQSGVDMKRLTVVIDTAPARPDLPSQKVKLEICSVPSYTRKPRLLSVNYPGLPDSYGNILVSCQSPQEILADKIVSFANTPDYIRYRDLWDMSWLMGGFDCASSTLSELVLKKASDYGCVDPVLRLLDNGSDLALTTLESEEFSSQMRRFLPKDVYAKTMARDGFLDAMKDRIEGLYGEVAEEVALKIGNETLEAQAREHQLLGSVEAEPVQGRSQVVPRARHATLCEPPAQ